MLLEIIRHLALKQPELVQFDNPVRIMYERNRKRGTSPLLKEVCTCLHAALDSFLRVFLILDALDECTEEVRQQMAATIKGLPIIVSALITSRPIVTIGQELGNHSHVTVSASNHDILEYVKYRIEDSVRL